jgi:DinB superfamily
MSDENKPQDESLRDHLRSLLRGGNAHLTFDDFIADFPAELSGQKVEGLPYTAWQVLEHMRLAQWDILEFSRSAKHVSPKWPAGYWPAREAIGTTNQWNESIEKFQADLKEMENLVADPATDLFAKIPHGSGQTILREALLVADHNAYHLGVLLAISRMLRK